MPETIRSAGSKKGELGAGTGPDRGERTIWHSWDQGEYKQTPGSGAPGSGEMEGVGWGKSVRPGEFPFHTRYGINIV